MDLKEQFKDFVRSNPKLVKYVNKGEKSWQDFYELYSLYGSDNEVWKEFLESKNSENFDSSSIMSFFKALDLDSIQNGISSIQRVLGVFEDLGGKNSGNINDEYKPRPLYKHFED